MKPIHQIKSELSKAAHLEDTEATDYWRALLNVHSCSTGASDAFLMAIEDELRDIHEWVFSTYEIVEVTETITHTRKVLRWKHKESDP